MKFSGLAFAVCFAVALALSSRPAIAAQDAETQVSVGAASSVTEFKSDDKVKEPKDKKPKSKKNDGKDSDPDDGDAGSGNDDKVKPNDGPAND